MDQVASVPSNKSNSKVGSHNNENSEGEFTVCAYRDFYDIPRLMAAVDRAGKKWIFDCEFNKELDKYEEFYRVYSPDPGAADDDSISSHLNGASIAAAELIPVSSLHFDETRRNSFFLGIS